jgi:uncharacterized protein
MPATAPLIDCDVHVAVPDEEALYPYLPGHFREFMETRNQSVLPPTAVQLTYPAWLPTMATAEAALTPDVLSSELRGRAKRVILNCYVGPEGFTHPYLGPAVASAVNRWIAEQWLESDAQVYASAVITPQHTAAAVEEIHRVAADPGFVQIVVPARSGEGYGQQRYWPIWEAAAEHGLAVAIGYGGASASPPTPVGWLGSFFEHYCVAPTNFQANVLSLTMSGIFAHQPSLRFVLVESGWTWLPAFLWRLDEHWRALHREVPWVREPPSAYIRRHFRCTTQPIDSPGDPDQLAHVIEQIGGPGLLMFGSDYPRHDDQGIDMLTNQLSPSETRDVMWENAYEWYRLDERE